VSKIYKIDYMLFKKVIAAALMLVGIEFMACASLSGCSSDDSEKPKQTVEENDENQIPDPMDEDHVVVAYVSSWSAVMPEPTYMTHINYAFGHVSESFSGIDISSPENLKNISALKGRNPELKVLLSVGGWGSGRFSEMAADPVLRTAFAKDCRRVVDEYKIDGIDIDWEYPGSDVAGISSSPDDPANFVLLLKEIREELGDGHLLTIASGATGTGLLFDRLVDYVDYVNIMSYDLAEAPSHHAPLYSSRYSGHITADGCVDKHLKAGVPSSKLVLGVPFYGRGCGQYARGVPYNKITVLPGCTERWDEDAKVPYIVDAGGKFVLGFENARSLTIKRKYIKEKGLKGIMYWEYSQDNDASELRRAAAGMLKVE